MRSSLILTIIFLAFNSYAQDKPDLDVIDDACVIVEIYDHKGRTLGHGSGFFIDSIGTVVTNYHVVKDGTSFKVIRELNNGSRQEFNVEKIISGNEDIDVATIQIKNPLNTNLTYLNVSESLPKKGDECWAIGTPADPLYMNTISTGIISNIHLNGMGGWTGIMLQTTAEITHGSSGGALINSLGEVIGVTSGGDPSEDGARASINLAISADEIENLDYIGKKNLINPSMIPCEISFFTNSQYTGDAYLYVNMIYAGKLTKYFLNNITPECGQEGTITRSVFQGVHTWQVYFPNTRSWAYGSFDAQPGGCFKVKVNSRSYNSNFTWFQPRERTKIEDKNLYRWGIYSGLVFTESGNGIPISVHVEKSYFEREFALRGHLHFRQERNEGPDVSSYNSSSSRWKYFGIGLDAKKLYIYNYKWDWSMGLFSYYRSLKNISTSIEYDWSTFPETETEVETIDNYNHLFLGVRFGGDYYIFPKLYFNMNLGLGYKVYFDRNNRFGSDFNLLIGYRF